MPPSGTRLGPYEIVSLIGAGGMGEVYRGRDARLGRDVAIKILPPLFSSDPDRLHRFEQEARAAAALSHPNILAVYDVGEQNGSPYIVSELLEGEPLRNKVQQPLPHRRAIGYATAIADGQLVELDAYETLRKVTGADGRLDATRFESVVGTALRALGSTSDLVGVHAELGHVTQPLLSLRVSTDLRRRLHTVGQLTLEYGDHPADCAGHGERALQQLGLGDSATA